MALHIVKLCVGAQSIEDLSERVRRSAAENRKVGRGDVHAHVTRMHPRRQDELLDGGSIYWVIKGLILARQKIVGFEGRVGADGVNRCAIMLAPNVIPTEPAPKRAFQGWRYLRNEDAPKDADGVAQGGQALRMELAELGLL